MNTTTITPCLPSVGVGDMLASCPTPRHVQHQMSLAHAAQIRWQQTSIAARLKLVRRVRHALAERADLFTESIDYSFRRDAAETIAGEILPLAESCRFLEQHASRVLRPQRLRRRSRPKWLPGVTVQLRREPFGVVLVLGAANYPLLLVGVQALQALTAGNAVAIKPGRQGQRVALAFAQLLIDCGFDPDLVPCLSESPEDAQQAMQAGIDKLVLTGAYETGRKVLPQLVEGPTPAVLELSGSDVLIALPDADMHHVARSLAFSLRFNNSSTCIAARRVLVPLSRRAELEASLTDCLAGDQAHATHQLDPPPRSDDGWLHAASLVQQAIRSGARVVWGGVEPRPSDGVPCLVGTTVVSDVPQQEPLARSEFFAPVTSIGTYETIDEAVAEQRSADYALGASVFGSRRDAEQIASQLDAGCVVVNDLIAPTADPRVPFGGRKRSGYGVTRGAAGLLEMTQLKAVVTRRGRFLPHLDATSPHDQALLRGMLNMLHGRRWLDRGRGLIELSQSAIRQHTWKTRKRVGDQSSR